VFNDLQGNAHPAYGPSGRFPHQSPDATRAAFTIPGSGGRIDPDHNLGATTQLFHNGVIVGAVNGVFQLWLDDSRVAAATYAQDMFGEVDFTTMTIYDGAGNALAPANLPDPRPSGQDLAGALISVDGRLVYLRYRNAVYDTVTGSIVWQGELPISHGTVVGHRIVYTKGRHVFRGDLFAAPTP
jgi:hypothetical protein